MKIHSLICPDPDPAQGKTRQLIEELARGWREGSSEGAAQIAAVVDLLSDQTSLPDLFKPVPGGPTYRFLMDFLRYIREAPASPSAWLERVKEGRGWDDVPLSAVGFSSATGALTTALSCSGAAGGEVVTASFNYVGVANAIMAAGAVPRFVDIDPRTWCMGADEVARAITKKTRAVILTHLNCFADIEPYESLFRRRGLEIPLIQDASLAIASTREGVRPGLVNVGPGGITVMSLTISKIFSGLGGAVATSHDQGLLEMMHDMAHQGVGQSDPSVLTLFGTNCKMSALNAAIAHAQLKRRKEIVARRIELRALYEEGLSKLVKRGLLSLQELGDESVATHFGAVLPADRRQISRELYDRFGVQTGVWHAHHTQKLYRIFLGKGAPRLPNTERIAERLTFLPFHTALSDDDVNYICRSLESLIASKPSPARRASPSAGGVRPRAKTPRSKGRTSKGR